MNRAVLLAALGVAASAWAQLAPRSAVYGQTGAALGRGVAGIQVSTGVGVQMDTSPQDPTGPSSYRTTSTSLVGVPSFEANAQLGLTDWLGINLHASPAGVEPGAKFSFLRGGSLQLSLLPELAVGFSSSGATKTTVTGTNPVSVDQGTTYNFNIAVGLKLLLSYRDGLYGGIGYAYQVFSTNQVNAAGVNLSSAETASHNLSVALGFNLTAGPFSLRPEVDFLLLPANSQTNSVGLANPTTLNNGVELVFFPCITIGVASNGPAGKARQLEGMRPEELALPPLVPAP